VKRAGWCAAAGLVAGLWGATAEAGDTSLDGLRGTQHVWSADTAGRGVLSAGLALSGHALEDTALAQHYYMVDEFQLGLGLGRWLELGAALPLRAWRATGVTAGRIDPNSLVGFGDLTVAGKVRLPLPGEMVRLGLVYEASLPTGSTLRSMSSGSTDAEFGGLLTVDLSHQDRMPPTRIHLNLTRRWNRNETAGTGLAPPEAPLSGGFWPPAYPAVPAGGQPQFNDALRWQVALEFNAAHLSLFTEFVYQQFWHLSGTEWRDHPLWVTEGACWHLRHGLQLRGAVDVSLQSDEPPATLPRLPEWRFHAGVTWSRTLGLGDHDGDGVADKLDLCPNLPEDLDGFQDADGCPELDNDGDGVPDRVDLAPNVAEDKDGYRDDDGRPDLDNDGDGIRDTEDACPNEAEDYDGDRDTDGCPDLGVPAVPPPPSTPRPEPAPTSPPAPPPGP
jgi:hypothetical protein